MRNPTFLSLSSGCIFADEVPEKDGDGRSRSRLSPENGGSKVEIGEKIGMGADGTDELDKMRDARCKSGDGMEVEDEMENWGCALKRQDGAWCQPSIMIEFTPSAKQA